MLCALSLRDGVSVDTVGLPSPRLVRPVGLRDDTHLLADHKCRVEAHTKLADNINISDIVALGILGFKLERIGVRDGSEILVEIILCHTSAVIRHGNSLFILIERDSNSQIGPVDLHRIIHEASKIELVDSIGCIRD